MKSLNLLILLCVNLCFGQDTISIAKQDTIYIILPETESSTEKNFKNFKFITSGNREMNEVKFVIDGGHPIGIYTRKLDKDNKRVKRKSFLEKNKDKIINMRFIETYTPKKVFVDILGNLDNRKVVYLINENQFKKRKIVLKKAFLNIMAYIEM